MSLSGSRAGRLVSALRQPFTRRSQAKTDPGGRVLWLRLLSEASRMSSSGGAVSAALVIGGVVCYAVTRSRPPVARFRRAWWRIGRRVVETFGWEQATLVSRDPGPLPPRGLLAKLEREYARPVQSQLETALQDALDDYQPACKPCGVSMYRDHSYSRSLLTRHGELQLNIPMFRCADCGAIASGMDVVGQERARRYSADGRGEPSASQP